MPQTMGSFQTTYAAGSNLNKIFEEVERRHRLTAKAGEVNAKALQDEYKKSGDEIALGVSKEALATRSLANSVLEKIANMKRIMNAMCRVNSREEVIALEKELIPVLNSLPVRGSVRGFEPKPKWGLSSEERDLIVSNVRVFIDAAKKEAAERAVEIEKQEKFNNSFIGKIANGLSNREKFDKAKDEHQKNSRWGKFVSKLNGNQTTNEIENEETQMRR